MNELIQKLIEIGNIESQIAILGIGKLDSPGINVMRERREQLLRETFTSIGRIYYGTDWTPLSSLSEIKAEECLQEIIESAKKAVIRASNRLVGDEDALELGMDIVAKTAEHGCGYDMQSFHDRIEHLIDSGELKAQQISCSVCGGWLVLQSDNVVCDKCGHKESSPKLGQAFHHEPKPTVLPSPDEIDEPSKAWLIDKIRDNVNFSELINKIEEEIDEPRCTVSLCFFVDLLEEQGFNTKSLINYSDEDLKRFIDEKSVESDIARQKIHLDRLLYSHTAEGYHVQRMLDLIKEAATSCNNKETLAKLLGYIDLGN